MVLHINSGDEFQEKVLDSQKPVIIDFWADWCGPCRTLGPIFEDLSKDYEGRVEFVKIDVDTLGEVAAKYSVASIPTLIIIRDGEAVAQTMGVMPKSVLKNFIDSNVK